ncbi:hypothetical protein P9390_24525, partial [Escherichia coli]
MTSLKTSIKTITYLSDIGCLEIQGASLVIAFGCFVLINDFYEDKVLWSYFVAGALCAKIKEINIEKTSLRAVIYIVFAFLFYM